MKLAAVLALCLAASSARAQAPGSHAPELGLRDRAGHVVTLRALRGQVVVVDIWASWCAPCASAFPSLQRLYATYRARGVTVVGVAEDNSASAVSTFLSRHPASFPIVPDTARAVGPRYAVSAMPSTYVIDQRGIVRFVRAGFHGASTSSAIESEVRGLLGI